MENSVIGIGTDITKISRITCLIYESDPFFSKSYTEKELEQAAKRDKPELYYVTRWAGKEAVYKCFGSKSLGFRPKEIEILESNSGQPIVHLHGDTLKTLNSVGGTRVLLSLSYDSEYAVAFALISK